MITEQRLALATRRRERASSDRKFNWRSDDRRQAQRKPCQKRAVMVAPAWHGPVSCNVEDISSTGSRVRLAEGMSQRLQRMPERVLLRLPVDRTEVECSIVWKERDEMGLKYATFFRGPNH